MKTSLGSRRVFKEKPTKPNQTKPNQLSRLRALTGIDTELRCDVQDGKTALHSAVRGIRARLRLETVSYLVVRGGRELLMATTKV